MLDFELVTVLGAVLGNIGLPVLLASNAPHRLQWSWALVFCLLAANLADTLARYPHLEAVLRALVATAAQAICGYLIYRVVTRGQRKNNDSR